MQFFVVQNILAKLLKLKPQQLTLLPREEEQKLLHYEPGRVELAKTVLTPRLLGFWSATTGYQPVLDNSRPCEQHFLFVANWATYLQGCSRSYGRHGWALFELHEELRATGDTRTRYVLVPLLNAVHLYAEDQAFTPAAIRFAA